MLLQASATDEAKKRNHVLRKLEKRKKDRTLDPHIEEQFASGRLLACLSSPPSHCGRADGYILEKELEFYIKKIQGCWCCLNFCLLKLHTGISSLALCSYF
ncbi:hypothetical protein CICLE_v10003097mg [Citrus x clementina]|uniref:Uncharacterized protein n=1 Tax=Citrus clementina TaxID=85681 RepID=V4T0A1_CITCL|nr:hypothetical protein CICLE_v10003097mg [Citrus x clementina]